MKPIGQPGTIYLLHFDPPVAHARHYLGWAKDHMDRINKHLAGQGSPLVKAAVENGSHIECVRIWENKDRNFERKLKNRKNTKKLCPVCKET